MPFEDILERFQPGVRRDGPDHAMARCHTPTHRDSDPSVSIRRKGDRTLVFDHAGCMTPDVLAAVGLTLSDLFATSRSSTDEERPAPTPAHKLTLDAFAEAKGFSVAFLEQLGVKPHARGLVIEYHFADGTLAPRQRLRLALKAGGGGSEWLGPKGEALVAYGLDRLDEARERGELLLVEGETDAMSAWF